MKFKTQLFNFTLWWSVIGASIWLGGTIFMMSVINPQWTANPPASVYNFFTHTAFNTYIWYFFGPPFMMLRSAVPQLLALLLGWQSKLHRRYLFITFIGTVITIVFTLAYIYPINDILMAEAGGNNTPEVIMGLTAKWVLCDRIRFVINLIGYIYLLKAFRWKPGEKPA